MNKWFYLYSEVTCQARRDEHAAEKPEDECGAPEEHPSDYLHTFYS
jgi:hypothetical protein